MRRAQFVDPRTCVGGKCRCLSLVLAALLALTLAALLAGPRPAWAAAPEPGVLAAPAAPAVAGTPDAGGAPPPPASQSDSTEPPQRTVTPNPGSTPNPGGSPGPSATPAPTPSHTSVLYTMLFPDTTFADSIVRVGTSIMTDQANAASDFFSNRVLALITDQYGLAPGYDPQASPETPLFKTLVRPQWNVTVTIAMALAPLTLVLMVLGLMRLGAGSALAQADLKEGVLGWLVSLALAGSSYFFLAAVHGLVTLTTEAILTKNLFGASFGMTDIVAGLRVGAFYSVLPLPIQLFLAFFTFIAIVSLTVSLGLALMAYVALVFVLTVLAPVVFAIAAVPFLRWLSEVWLKALVQVFMLPVIDALLLRVALDLQHKLVANLGQLAAVQDFNFTAVVTALLSVIVLLALLSLLIGINFKIGQLVFGGLFQAAGQAASLVSGVANGALNIMGAPVGFGVAAALGGSPGDAEAETTTATRSDAEDGSAAAGDTRDGGDGEQSASGAAANRPGVSTSGERTGAGLSRAGQSTMSPTAYRARISQLQQRDRQARKIDGLARGLSMSGLPGMRAIGAGMGLATSVASARASGEVDQLRRQQQAEREDSQDRGNAPADVSPRVNGVPRTTLASQERAADAQVRASRYQAQRAEEDETDQRGAAVSQDYQAQRRGRHLGGSSIDAGIERDIETMAAANRAPAGAKLEEASYRGAWADWQNRAVSGESPFARGLADDDPSARRGSAGQDDYSAYFHWQALHHSAATSPRGSGELAEMLYRPYHNTGHMTPEGLGDMERLFSLPDGQGNPLAQNALQFIPAAHALAATHGFELPENFDDRAWHLMGHMTGTPDFTQANEAAVAGGLAAAMGFEPAGSASAAASAGDLSVALGMVPPPEEPTPSMPEMPAPDVDLSAAERFDSLSADAEPPAMEFNPAEGLALGMSGPAPAMNQSADAEPRATGLAPGEGPALGASEPAPEVDLSAAARFASLSESSDPSGDPAPDGLPQRPWALG